MAGCDNGWNHSWMEWSELRSRCKRDIISGRQSRWTRATVALMVVTTVVTAVATTLLALVGGWLHEGQPLQPQWSGVTYAEDEVIKMIQEEIQIARFTAMDFNVQCTLNSEQSPGDKVLKGWNKDCRIMNVNGTYTVPSNGFFLLYTRLSFNSRSPRDSVETGVGAIFWQELWRTQDEVYRDLVFKDVESVDCSVGGRNLTASVCHRSEISVVLRLAEGDRISIEVSHPHLVRRSDGSSYFGAVKVA